MREDLQKLEMDILEHVSRRLEELGQRFYDEDDMGRQISWCVRSFGDCN